MLDVKNRTGGSNGKVRVTTIGILAGILFIVTGIGCSTDKEEAGLYAVATVFKGDVTVLPQAEQVAVGTKVAPGATIKTGKNAMAVFQVTGLGLFRVLEQTTVTFAELTADNSHFRLKKGAVFAKMQKLKKDQDFRISSISAVAAVRGTQFLIQSKNKKPRVIVSEGSVSVTTQIEDMPKEEVILTAGQTATLAAPAKKTQPKLLVRKLNVSERLNMQQFNIAGYFENLSGEDESGLNKAATRVLTEESAFEKANRFKMVKIGEEDLSPIDRLRKQGKPLTKVFLIGGEILIGFVESQDAKVIKLNTGDGLITIRKKDIIKREFTN